MTVLLRPVGDDLGPSVLVRQLRSGLLPTLNVKLELGVGHPLLHDWRLCLALLVKDDRRYSLLMSSRKIDNLLLCLPKIILELLVVLQNLLVVHHNLSNLL